MAELKFLQTVRNNAGQIKTDTRTWISRVYKRANTLFTEASPFAQIISVFGELYELIMFYIEDAIVPPILSIVSFFPDISFINLFLELPTSIGKPKE